MLDNEAVELAFSGLGQRVPGRPQIGELGLAAAHRARDGSSRADSSEHFAGMRLNELSVCQSWLPRLNRLRRSSRASISPFGVEVGNVGDVRAQPHLCAGIVRINLERAEEPAKRQLLLVAHRLVRKDEDTVTIECCVDLGKDLGITGRVRSTPRTSAPRVG